MLLGLAFELRKGWLIKFPVSVLLDQEEAIRKFCELSGASSELCTQYGLKTLRNPPS